MQNSSVLDVLNFDGRVQSQNDLELDTAGGGDVDVHADFQQFGCEIWSDTNTHMKRLIAGAVTFYKF